MRSEGIVNMYKPTVLDFNRKEHGFVGHLAEPQEVVFPKTDNIKIMTFDGSQTVDCISVRYSRIVFPAKNEPPYILQAVDRVGFLGAHTIILGWYNDEESVKNEMEAIVKAMDQEQRTYKLKYFTVVEFKGIFGQASRK